MKKVSLISPCYNGESHLGYFLDSLLAQTYRNVEFIFVDDGSTDRTGEIFASYKERLEAKGWTVRLICQENKGQAAAVNAGLKLVSGDYLIWPDSDDILYPEHIAKKAEFMEKNPNLGIGFCRLDKVNENNLDKITGYMERRPEKEDNLFEDLLANNNILWPPIGAIVRMSAFDKVNPQREIYAGRGGQNFQMMLPVAACCSAGYINESLGKYVVRKSSHSKTPSDLLLQRHMNLLNIWVNTIQNLHGVSDDVKAKSLATACAYFDFVCPGVKSLKLLGIPLVSVVTKNHKKKVKLFSLLNIMTIVKRGHKIKGRLFGLIPFSVK